MAEEKCCDLAVKVDELNKLLRLRQQELEEKERLVERLQIEAADGLRREQRIAAQLLLKDEEIRRVYLELDGKEELVSQLEEQSVKMEAELEEADSHLRRMETELAAREEEIKSMSALSGHSAAAGIHAANVLDVSVDDKLLMEDMSGSNSPTPNKKTVSTTPSNRGPSASSTPNRSRRGSIVEELKEAGFNTGFPSPLCGKGIQDQKLAKRLLQEMDKWQSTVHRAIIEEVGGTGSAKLIAVLNKVMNGVKKEVVWKEVDEEEAAREDELKKEVEALKAQLALCQDELQKEKEATSKEKERFADLEMVEGRVTEMACLLQAANRALLATGGQPASSRENSRPSSPGGGAVNELTGEEDALGEWQLDLEGIELIEWNNNLSRKLVQYSKQLRDDLSRVEGGRDLSMDGRRAYSLLEGGKGLSRFQDKHNSLLLSSLFSRLDELNAETEKSR